MNENGNEREGKIITRKIGSVKAGNGLTQLRINIPKGLGLNAGDIVRVEVLSNNEIKLIKML